ncbi:MAG: LytTR family DNA-binding domain-containing protein [Gammaproteobacteria bacterium]|nr:LytTR family DNA-binding domain-containing protein [Gammaproteobacteria bacterium]
MRILIVDDEPLARGRLVSQIAELDAGEVVGEAADGLACLAAVEQHAPDVVLLDVRMPGMDGIEVARRLRDRRTPPVVIFTTAYDEHALAAFESQALDYLLKPVRLDRLRAALERAASLRLGRELLAEQPAAAGGRRRHVSAMAGGTLRFMPIGEVLYFQADQGYVSAVGKTGKLLIEDSLRALEEEFAEDFVRIHRNALVAPAHVRALERDAAGNVAVVLEGRPERLLISRRLLPQVRKRLRGL